MMAELSEGIYIASKTRHAHLWRDLRGAGARCKTLIVYRETEDVLKGAWVEIGAALSAGKPVYAVGLNGFTISKYRGIKHFPSLADAFKAAGWPAPVGGSGT